jgi:hypothetical protein
MNYEEEAELAYSLYEDECQGIALMAPNTNFGSDGVNGAYKRAFVRQYLAARQKGEERLSTENQQEIARRNMKYLELNARQYKIHKKLMAINMDKWPEPLKKYLSEKHGKDMFCGDALMCWVADWIRSSKKTYLI